MIAIRQAVADIVKRAKTFARVTGRTNGGVSKAIFDDTRTLDALARGRFNVRLDRVLRGESRLTQLEQETWGRAPRPRARKGQGGKRKST